MELYVLFPLTPSRYNQPQWHCSFTARDLGLKETSPFLNADGQMVGWLVLKTEQTKGRRLRNSIKTFCEVIRSRVNSENICHN